MSEVFGIMLEEYDNPNVLLFGSESLDNSELNIDMEISFENRF